MEGYAVGIIDDIAYCPHHEVVPTIKMEKLVDSFALVCPECDYKIPALSLPTGLKNATRST